MEHNRNCLLCVEQGFAAQTQHVLGHTRQRKILSLKMFSTKSCQSQRICPHTVYTAESSFPGQKDLKILKQDKTTFNN